MKVRFAKNPELSKVPNVKHGLGKNIARRAFLSTRNSAFVAY